MLDNRRKRLLYRSNYRGFKEADLILGGFAKANIETLTDIEVTMFEHLLEARDHDIYNWVIGKVETPAEYENSLMERLRSFDPSPL